MNVGLTPELEAFVLKEVESGQYNNASEVIREGLRRLMIARRTNSPPPQTLEDLLAEVRADSKAGRTRELTPELWDEIQEGGRRMAAEAAPIPWYISGEW
ncbi:MAG TPA: type II toxin-antitoxin system ParD family antitoxin [Thermomicrobiales bacterium]|nr:type II toxin-antitoxin system ParD family antitoxin [Thermomicrobiales bacterium]